MLEEAWHFSGLSYPELLWHNIRETETFRLLIAHSHWHEVGLGYCWLQSAQNYIYYLILISLSFLMIILYQERITSPSGSSSFFLEPLQYSGFSALGWQLPTCSEWHKSLFYLICIFSNKKKAHFSPSIMSVFTLEVPWSCIQFIPEYKNNWSTIFWSPLYKSFSLFCCYPSFPQTQLDAC